MRPQSEKGLESKIYIHFQPQKRTSNKSNNFSVALTPQGSARLRKMLLRLVILVAQLVSRHSCVADRLPVVARFPAGPRVRLKTVDPPKGNGLGQKKSKMLLRFSKFSVSVALTRHLRFWMFFWLFSLLCNLHDEPWFWDFWGFSFNRADKAFEIFLSNGDSGHYNTIRRVPKQVATKGPAIIPPEKLLEF